MFFICIDKTDLYSIDQMWHSAPSLCSVFYDESTALPRLDVSAKTKLLNALHFDIK